MTYPPSPQDHSGKAATVALALGTSTASKSTLAMLPSSKTRYGRWYDTTPELAYALDLLQILPSTHRSKLLQLLITQMQQHQPGLEAWLAAKQLQSEAKQGWLPPNATPHRWYDDDPLLVKLLGYLMLFTPVLRQFYAKQLLHLIKTI
jgi:hypothetical protein